MAEVKTTCREELLAKLREDPVWDVVVIGGGATGAGIAVDAASRGWRPRTFRPARRPVRRS